MVEQQHERNHQTHISIAMVKRWKAQPPAEVKCQQGQDKRQHPVRIRRPRFPRRFGECRMNAHASQSRTQAAHLSMPRSRPQIRTLPSRRVGIFERLDLLKFPLNLPVNLPNGIRILLPRTKQSHPRRSPRIAFCHRKLLPQSPYHELIDRLPASRCDRCGFPVQFGRNFQYHPHNPTQPYPRAPRKRFRNSVFPPRSAHLKNQQSDVSNHQSSFFL